MQQDGEKFGLIQKQDDSSPNGQSWNIANETACVAVWGRFGLHRGNKMENSFQTSMSMCNQILYVPHLYNFCFAISFHFLHFYSYSLMITVGFVFVFDYNEEKYSLNVNEKVTMKKYNAQP